MRHLDALGADAVLHAASEHDDAIGAAKREAIQRLKRLGDERLLIRDARRDEDIRIEIHRPVHHPRSEQRAQHKAEQRDVRRRRQADADIVAADLDRLDRRRNVEEAEIESACEETGLAVEAAPDSMNLDSVDALVGGQRLACLSVQRTRRDHADLMTLRDEEPR